MQALKNLLGPTSGQQQQPQQQSSLLSDWQSCKWWHERFSVADGLTGLMRA